MHTEWLTECPNRQRWTARLLAKSEPDSQTGCVNWTGKPNDDGYGVFTYYDATRIGNARNRSTSAPRAAWLALVGPIAEGFVPDHLCRNRLCINVAHMEIVTIGENSRRGVALRKPISNFRCGHPRTPENDWAWTVRATGTVKHRCRTCTMASRAA